MESIKSPAVVQPSLTTSGAWDAAGPLLSWVGKNLASGIVGAIGGKIFNDVLSFIKGGGLELEDLAKELDKINGKLDQVQLSLNHLLDLTKEILAELDHLRAFMAASIKQEKLINAIELIETVYGAPVAPPTGSDGAVSLYELTVTMPKHAKATPETLKKAGENFTGYAKGIPGAIDHIYSVLTKEAFGGVPLLNYWASRFILDIKEGKLSQETACEILEGYFLQAIAAQLKGVTLHCVAMGGEPNSDERISDYLVDNYAPKMRKQTSAYVQAIETILFATIKPTMAIGTINGGLTDPPEFPREITGLLLRADLLAAALNLAGIKPPPDGSEVPMNEAIQGIYGRAMLRPGDLHDGKPQPFAVRGYAGQLGAPCYKIPLRCINMLQSATPTELPVITDATTSLASVAHYYWPFPTPAPAAGTEIDSSQRDKVVPALYEVFGPASPECPPVLAASFLDVTHLYRTMDYKGEQLQAKFNNFNGGNDDAGIQTNLRQFSRNPLDSVIKAENFVFTWKYDLHFAWKAHLAFDSILYYHLFRYEGAPAKVRITAHIDVTLWRDARRDAGIKVHGRHIWDLNEALYIQKDGGTVANIYDSHQAYGHPAGPMSLESEQALANRAAPYRNQMSISVSQIFDLVPGNYTLVYQQNATIKNLSRTFWYKSWNKSGLDFKLLSVTMELVP